MFVVGQPAVDKLVPATNFTASLNRRLPIPLGSIRVRGCRTEGIGRGSASSKLSRLLCSCYSRATLPVVAGPTVVHLCFGYAHVVANKPRGYAFLPQLADTIAQQISIEAAQPRIDLGVLDDLSEKQIMLGVLDLGSTEVETAEQVADRIRAGLRHVAAERLIPAPDCGMKYMPRERAFGKLRALAEGAAIVRRELAG